MQLHERPYEFIICIPQTVLNHYELVLQFYGLHIKWGCIILRIFPYPHNFLIAMAQNDRTQTHGLLKPFSVCLYTSILQVIDSKPHDLLNNFGDDGDHLP